MHHLDRLHRPRAYNDPGHAHELTFSCYRRFPFLARDRTCRWLADAIHEACAELSYDLWAYVFMPDHAHLVVRPCEPQYDTSLFLKRVKEPVSRAAVAFLKQESPKWLPRIRTRKGGRDVHHFWQPGRGHGRNVTEPRTLESMIEYVHLNPVRKGLVERARDWTWSSAAWFEGRSPNALEPDPIPPEWSWEAS